MSASPEASASPAADQAIESLRRDRPGSREGIEHRILDSIQGHRPRNVAEEYGEVTIKTQAAAIAKMPRYKAPL